ncbi:phage tail sheath family protein [Aliiglaciecola sp. M165]|uniref:phage tail sheath family protein n=1 Tax=Aliiglaciecola sp. M165 TaxID=2593649 RepID=UPI00117C2498|nr:phage tail sheath C-terminal domain-containing protein [Aliiglaciecola sp. M165]TRY29856.1 phage tail protein [Aliiglaciecola sp. M165]
MAYKTPGVYVKEISIFPPSVAEVETAIPAFIGYTQKAEKKGEGLTNVPTKISSLLDFVSLFGGEYDIASDTGESVAITVDQNNNFAVTAVQPSKRFYLYEALRQFFDNGGGDCYIVSVGSFSDDVTLGNSADPANFPGLSVGLKRLEKYDEPTIILYPDAPLLTDTAAFYTLQQRTLAQCANLQDRVGLFDLYETSDRELDEAVEEFRNNIGINNLKYGAAYAPWLHTAYKKTINMKVFQDSVTLTDGTPQALEELTADADLNALVTTAKTALTDQVTLSTMVSDILTGQNENSLKARYATLRNALMASDDANAAADLTALLDFVQSVTSELPELATDLLGDNLKLDLAAYAKDKLKSSIHDLVAVEKNADVIALTTNDAAAVNTRYVEYDATGWLDEFDSSPADGDIVSEIAATTTDYAVAAGAKATALNILVGKPDPTSTPTDEIVSIDAIFDGINNFVNDMLEAAQTHVDITQATLYETHTIVGNIVEHIKREYSKVPPSGSVAGLYAFVDNARGVWKAPANVSVNAVRGPVEAIDSNEQESLNVDVTGGKSINAIRTFTGRGTIVWGARTLAGNDNEWRYVPVRRFFNMVEESVKKSTAWAVFEPNTAQLWSKIKGMIDNYLIQKWREGALAGSTPEEAFFVKIGLGETMTAQDILEGRLYVEIGMAAVRPAEFIILKFMHKLQES